MLLNLKNARRFEREAAKSSSYWRKIGKAFSSPAAISPICARSLAGKSWQLRYSLILFCARLANQPQMSIVRPACMDYLEIFYSAVHNSLQPMKDR